MSEANKENNSTTEIKFDLSKPWQLFATGFGSGLAKKAPGTFGTIAALPFAIPLMMLPWWQMTIVCVLAFIIGVWFCQKTSDDLNVHDHGGIVWDEFVGMWITLIAVPLTSPNTIWYILIGFVLFRFFDILKPWPIKWLDQKVHGGFGIMIDDVLAGIFAWGILQLIIIYLF
jgi:phosphatidylglycerophosphatase A